jgi:hypothetical protein
VVAPDVLPLPKPLEDLGYTPEFQGNTFVDTVTKISAGSLVDASFPRRTGFVLCIDGNFSKGGGKTITLGDLLEPLHAQLRAELDIKHYKLAEFGKGVGILNEALRQRLEQDPIGSDVTVLVNSRTPEGSDVLNLLESYAGLVFRGM